MRSRYLLVRSASPSDSWALILVGEDSIWLISFDAQTSWSNDIVAFIMSWTEIQIWSEVRRQFRPCHRLSSGPWYQRRSIWAFAITSEKTRWFLHCLYLCSFDSSPYHHHCYHFFIIVFINKFVIFPLLAIFVIINVDHSATNTEPKTTTASLLKLQ